MVWFYEYNYNFKLLYGLCTTPRVKPPSHVANIMAAQNKINENTETRQMNNNVQAPTEIAMEQLKEINKL